MKKKNESFWRNYLFSAFIFFTSAPWIIAKMSKCVSHPENMLTIDEFEIVDVIDVLRATSAICAAFDN